MPRNKTLLPVLAAASAVTAMQALPSLAGEITGFTGVTGDGVVIIDATEGVVEPGIKPSASDGNGDGVPDFQLNNDDFTSRNGFSPAPPEGVDYNCLMASNDNLCDAAPGTGKRIKTQFTGRSGFDLAFAVTPSGGVTEYFTYGKVTNNANARILGFTAQLGTTTGGTFVPMDPANPETKVLFDQLVELSERASEWPGLGGATTGQNPLQRAFYPGGLFGEGGQEGAVGFFDGERAGYVFTQNEDGNLIVADQLFNDVHIALFGDGTIARNQIPDGIFWDDDANPETEGALVAWYNPSANGGAGAWLYGAIGVPGAEEPDNDLAVIVPALASALGVDEASLDYEPGGVVPASIVAAIRGNPALFDIAGIEDLSNINLNFSIDVGDILGGNFTLRFVPVFAPIVQVAATDYQFNVAASLDAANIPFLGADPGYLTLADAVLALGTPELQRNALERLGFSFLGTFDDLSMMMARDHVFGLGSPLDGYTASPEVTRGGAGRWHITDTLSGFLSFGGGQGDVARTSNNIGYEYDSRAVTAGVEFLVDPETLMGFSIGVGESEADIDDDRGQLEAESVSFVVHGETKLANGIGVRGLIGYQNASLDSTRVIDAGGISATALGSTDAKTLFFGVEADWMRQRGNFAFGPMGALEHYRTSIDGFTETGAGLVNIAVAERDVNTTIAMLGVRGEYDVNVPNGEMSLYGHIGLAARNGSSETVATEFGSVLPGLTPVDGASETWTDLGLGVSRSIGDRMTLGAEYRGALFSDDYESHQARLFVDLRF